MTPQSQLIFDKSDLVRSRNEEWRITLTQVKKKMFWILIDKKKIPSLGFTRL